MMTGTSVLWFRRDLRLADHPALLAAHDAAAEVLPVFVLDPALAGPAGAPRMAYLARSLRALDDSLGGRLVVRHGDPVEVLPALAREVAASSVHISADFGPYGRRRDAAVEQALGDVPLIRTGSPYAVAPGRVTKDDGTPYAMFTPFSRAWRVHGWHAPASGAQPRWATGVRSDPPPDDSALALPPAGEAAALRRWEEFRAERLGRYKSDRDRPDLDGSSRLSHHLKWGELHPRTLLADLDDSTGATAFRTELAWREFYADVLWHEPASAREYLKKEMAALEYDAPGPELEAWKEGRTGFPIVDAGMRQLLESGWVHNRVRMIVASFLVKDLHVEWMHGARHFMRHLLDADLASNQHGWQWVAGSGTDAAPFFRVFNPVLQGKKFDPSGEYVRRWVPELRALGGASVHEPWKFPGGPPPGYPLPIVDHAAERAEALRRYAARR